MWTISAITATAFAGLVGAVFWLYPWIKYDFKTLWRGIKLQVLLNIWKKKKLLLVDIFEKQVKKFPSKLFLRHGDLSFTYMEAQKKSNQVANFALDLGLTRGSTVAVLMYNEPMFVWFMLGMAKIGVEVAFINYNLRHESLLHCLQTSQATIIFVGGDSDLQEAISEKRVSDALKDVKICTLGKEKNDNALMLETVADQLAKASESDLERDIYRKDTHHGTCAGYIFTSGTTGLPKAAIVSHGRMLIGSRIMSLFDNITNSDVIYTPLPLYHSAAGLIAIGATIQHGCTLVLRKKFSASQFWKDCHDYDVTVVQYIGELCRYLLASSESEYDKNHKVRLAVGNGLRRDIWEQFQNRFGVSIIGEFYAATEGAAGFFNACNKTGAIGRMSPILKCILPVHLIEYDFGSALPVRNKDGFCKKVKPGVPGLFVCEIKGDISFDGYKGNKDMTAKKLLHNVFKKGDVFFNSGDVLLQDDDYFLYFADRIGDTFRWKGENVSTIEVGNILTKVPWIQDANVFGIEIKGYDGRCGMAALTTIQQTDMNKSTLLELYESVQFHLPPYAQPIFLRVLEEDKLTSTFKQMKGNLVKEGFNPDMCGNDRLYWLSRSQKTYEVMTKEIYEEINNGKIRL